MSLSGLESEAIESRYKEEQDFSEEVALKLLTPRHHLRQQCCFLLGKIVRTLWPGLLAALVAGMVTELSAYYVITKFA